MHQFFERSAARFAELVGSSWVIALALMVPLTWFFMTTTSPDQKLFGVGRISLVEFVNMFMFIHLFMMQRAQTKSVKALHLKLDELIASKDGANNGLIKAEGAPENVIDDLHTKYTNLAEAKKNSTAAVAVEERY